MRIRHPDHRARSDRFVLHSLRFDFGRPDPVARAFDHGVAASMKVKISLLVHMAEVARQAPFVFELVTHGCGVLPVLAHYYWRVAPNCDLTRLADLERYTFGRDDRDFVSRVGVA
jgi:hypothetical protein